MPLLSLMTAFYFVLSLRRKLQSVAVAVGVTITDSSCGGRLAGGSVWEFEATCRGYLTACAGGRFAEFGTVRSEAGK